MSGDVYDIQPFRWPNGRSRTAARSRQDGRFAGERVLSARFGAWRIQRELGLLGAGDIAVWADPQVEKSSGDPGVYVSFTLDGRRYGLACDQYVRAADNLVAISRHLELMRATARIGVAPVATLLQPFQTADQAAARPWRELLGDLSSEQQVTRVFRQLSNACHPDKPSGSHERMAELCRARDQALKELKLTQIYPEAEPIADAEVFVFEAKKHFEAMREAERFLEEHGFSCGRNERGFPRGIRLGTHCIGRWRDLSHAERAALAGRMTGDMRHGPVTVTISRSVLAQAGPLQQGGLRRSGTLSA